MQRKNGKESAEQCYLSWHKATQVICEWFDLRVPLRPRAGTEPADAVLAQHYGTMFVLANTRDTTCCAGAGAVIWARAGNLVWP